MDLDLIVLDEGFWVIEVFLLNFYFCAVGGVLYVCEGGIFIIYYRFGYWVGGIYKYC